MSIAVVFNGTSYSIPEAQEVGWANLTNFLVDVANNAQTTSVMKSGLRVALTSPVTVVNTDFAVVSNLTVAGAVTVNLPAGTTGKMFAILDGKGDAATNNITIDPAGADTINGSATYVISSNNGGVLLQYNATNARWNILSDFRTDIVTATSTNTLTNKTIDGDNNTLSDIALASIKTVGANTNRFVTRDGSGVISDATALPSGTVVGTSDAQVITAKDYDGGTASNTNRTTLAKNTSANLTALTRKEGNLFYDTTLTAPVFDNGSSLVQLATATTVQDSSLDYNNGTITASVAANALTIALKTKAGTDPTGGSPVNVSFRSSTSTSGLYVVRSVSAALSMTVSSGSTLGHYSSHNDFLYVYLLDNSGTVELAVSSTIYDDGSIVSTTAEGGAGAADSQTVIYSTTARSNVPIRLIGRMKSNQTTAGTWAAVPTEISNIPFSSNLSYAVNMDDVIATRLGLKGYSHGTTYAGGNAPTITLSSGGGTLSSISNSTFFPRLLQNNTWVLSGIFRAILSSAVRTTAIFAIAGIDFPNEDWAGCFQLDNNGANFIHSYTAASIGSGGRIVGTHQSSTTTTYVAQFHNVAITAKPTWAY